MDASGDVLTSAVPRTVPAFHRTLDALLALQALTEKAKAGKLDPEETGKYLTARIDLGQLDFAAARKEFAAVADKLGADQRKAIEAKLVDLEVQSVLAKQTQMRGQPREAIEDALAEDFGRMLTEGKIPSDAHALNFWLILHNAARRRGDDAMLERARNELTALGARNTQLQRRIDALLNPQQRGTVPATPVRPAGGGNQVPPRKER
ncbi:MAG TPA: hypothetical protein VK081_00850 [Planctomycetota bacterium]|nr:hypothetical protein [Planctomycetota bacterium]